jgi:hypothetical protein
MKTAPSRASVGASLILSPAASPPLTFTLANATCASCHGTPHGSQFAARPDGGVCQSCHDLRGWSPASRFVHEANGGFVLGAAHAKVPCASCHVVSPGAPAAAPANRAARVWRGVPRNCEACHRNRVPAR